MKTKMILSNDARGRTELTIQEIRGTKNPQVINEATAKLSNRDKLRLAKALLGQADV